jgi:hypothetical protein
MEAVGPGGGSSRTGPPPVMVGPGGGSRTGPPPAIMGIRILCGGLVVLGLITAAIAGDIKIQEWKFDKDAPGEVPSGFTPGKLNSVGGRWEVVADAKAPSSPNVLVRAATARSEKEPQIIFIDGLEAGSLDLTVRIKEPSVGENQGGGVVFRATDEQNYHVVWLSPDEKLLRLDKVVNGEINHIQDLMVDMGTPGTWHILRLLIHGPLMEATLNNRQFLSGREEKWEFGSYKKGKIGLWAKGKGAIYFDTVRYTNMDDTSASQNPFGTEPRGR